MSRRGATATRSEAEKTWRLIELHGRWWVYEGELPPPERFKAIGGNPNLRILGPYASRAIAEAMLHRHLSRRDPEVRTRA
jgi:hypothetical protein